MRRFRFVTLDVFTELRFGGNPLAVFPAADGLTDAEMLSLAAEFNLSETAFVFPPADARHTARVRIFNRMAEMPFAGHPTVGTGFVLGEEGRDRNGTLLFELPAGLAEVTLNRDSTGRLTGATAAAPQALTVGPTIPVDVVAACATLVSTDVIVDTHAPVIASVGTPYVIAEVSDAALIRALPALGRFRQAQAELPDLQQRFALHLYARTGEGMRARMFAPLAGTFEDPATGSANAALVALLLSQAHGIERTCEILQGAEMGRPSRLRVTASRTGDGIRAMVGGSCVHVLRGDALLG
jgi:trans-2,3-dihydro-3-hydroxyanthranilate isomerase